MATSSFFSDLLNGFGGAAGSTSTSTQPPPSDYYGTTIPSDAGARIASGNPWIQDRLLLGEGNMRNLANQITQEEKQRYQSGLGTLTSQYNASNAALSDLIDPNLLFSKAADATGARSIQSLNALRGSLGARGLSPNSGAAQGALSRLMYQNEAALTGATRDIAIENQNRRAVNAAQQFANALNLANYTNAPVSGANLETEQNIFEGLLAQKAIAEQRKSAKEAQKNNTLSGIISGGGALLGGLAGLL